jgi:hypothetical protein
VADLLRQLRDHPKMSQMYADKKTRDHFQNYPNRLLTCVICGLHYRRRQSKPGLEPQRHNGTKDEEDF